jgi:diguanylate cyclase (GGDEF)-like protein/PAS domain S-box-containing protein
MEFMSRPILTKNWSSLLLVSLTASNVLITPAACAADIGVGNTIVPINGVWLLMILLFVAAVIFIGSLSLRNKLLSEKLKLQSEKLHEQERQVVLLANNMSDWIWTLNANQQFIYVSPSVTTLLGYEPDELLQQNISKVLHFSEIERAYALMSYRIAIAKHGKFEQHKDSTIDVAHVHKNGQLVWTETAVRISFDEDGKFSGAQGASRDITERKKAEDTIRKLAFNDPLTKIANRRLLNDRIRQAQMGCARHKQYCAIFFIDLDNLKYVNDNYGHDNGDLLLQQVAQRLFLNARESDTVARFSGDEFVVMSEFLNPDYEDAREQALFAGVKLIELFEKDFMLNDVNCRLNVNIGVYLFNNDNKQTDYMLKRANAAMYQAKALGRNQLLICGESWVSEIAV